MLVRGLFRRFSQPLRYFSLQVKIKEAQDQHGPYSVQALEAQMAYAWSLFSQKKLEEAKQGFSQVIEVSTKVLGENSQGNSEIIQRIAKAYESIGDIETSLQYYIQAYKIDSAHLPADHEEILFAVNRIGAMYADLSDLKNSEDYLSRIFPFVQKSVNVELKAAYFGNLGHVRMRLGDREHSLQYFLLAKTFQEKIDPKDDMMVKYLQSIGMCYWVQNKYQLARDSFLSSLDLLEAKPSEESNLQIIDIYGHLAYLHNDMQLTEDMHAYFQKALDTFERSNVENKKEKIADYLRNIAETMKSVRDLQNTQTYLQKLLDYCHKNFAENSRFTASAYEQFSTFYLSTQRIPEALTFAEKSLNSRKALEKNHYDLLFSYNQYAAIYHTTGDLVSAQRYLGLSSDILSQFPNKRLETSHHHNLALLYRDQKNYSEAENHMKKHIAGVVDDFGEVHPAVAAGYSSLGHIFRICKNYDKSLEAYNKALRICDDTLGREHVTTAEYLEYIGEINRLKGDFKEALNFYHESENIKLKLMGPQSFALHTTYYTLGITFMETGEIDKAREYGMKRLDLLKGIYTENHSFVAGCYGFLAEVALKTRNKELALQNLEKAKSILVGVKNHTEAAKIEKMIEEIRKLE